MVAPDTRLTHSWVKEQLFHADCGDYSKSASPSKAGLLLGAYGFSARRGGQRRGVVLGSHHNDERVTDMIPAAALHTLVTVLARSPSSTWRYGCGQLEYVWSSIPALVVRMWRARAGGTVVSGLSIGSDRKA